MSRRLHWKRLSPVARELDAAKWVQDDIERGHISGRIAWAVVALMALVLVVRW